MVGRASTSGFTLIEMMIVLAIIALLLLLGFPSFATYLRNTEIRSTAESIANGLRVAQVEALRRNTAIAFTFVNGGTDPSWTINGIDRATLNLTMPPIQSFTTLDTGSNAIARRTPANAVSVVFDGLGRVRSPSPLPSPGLQQIDITSRIDGDSHPLRINVDNARGIRMCDPDSALAGSVPPDARAC